MKIAIDTDPGQDDAMALILAERSEVELELVTTVSGNSTIENTTRNAKHILEILDSDIPVYSGAEKPLERELTEAVVHGENGLEGLNTDFDPKLTGNAPRKIAENASRIDCLITLGPLTNVATAFQKYPEKMSDLDKIVMMGGAIEGIGNQNRVAEFNFWNDPEAAEIVFSKSLEKILVPLEPCNDTLLTEKHLKELEGSKLYTPMKKMLDPYMRNIKEELDVEGALMYDPLAVFAALKPSKCNFDEMDVVIETEGEHTRGMTVADRRNYSEKNPNCKVVTSIESSEFLSEFIEKAGKEV